MDRWKNTVKFSDGSICWKEYNKFIFYLPITWAQNLADQFQQGDNTESILFVVLHQNLKNKNEERRVGNSTVKLNIIKKKKNDFSAVVRRKS